MSYHKVAPQISPLDPAFYAMYFHIREGSFFKFPDVPLVKDLGYSSLRSMRSTILSIGVEGEDYIRESGWVTRGKIYFLRPEFFVAMTCTRKGSRATNRSKELRRLLYDQISNPAIGNQRLVSWALEGKNQADEGLKQITLAIKKAEAERKVAETERDHTEIMPPHLSQDQGVPLDLSQFTIIEGE